MSASSFIWTIKGPFFSLTTLSIKQMVTSHPYADLTHSFTLLLLRMCLNYSTSTLQITVLDWTCCLSLTCLKTLLRLWHLNNGKLCQHPQAQLVLCIFWKGSKKNTCLDGLWGKLNLSFQFGTCTFFIGSGTSLVIIKYIFVIFNVI